MILYCFSDIPAQILSRITISIKNQLNSYNLCFRIYIIFYGLLNANEFYREEFPKKVILRKIEGQKFTFTGMTSIKDSQIDAIIKGLYIKSYRVFKTALKDISGEIPDDFPSVFLSLEFEISGTHVDVPLTDLPDKCTDKDDIIININSRNVDRENIKQIPECVRASMKKTANIIHPIPREGVTIGTTYMYIKDVKALDCDTIKRLKPLSQEIIMSIDDTPVETHDPLTHVVSHSIEKIFSFKVVYPTPRTPAPKRKWGLSFME